jgi:paraquat-inducible protein A
LSNTNHPNDCHECGLLVVIPPLKSAQKAHCPRCGYQLTSFRKNAWQNIIAFSLSGLTLLLLSLSFEFLSFSAQGQSNSMSIISGIIGLTENGFTLLALVLLLTVLVLPCGVLVALLYLVLLGYLGLKVTGAEKVYRMLMLILPWSMAEIFIISVLVSLIKLTSLADVELGIAFFTYIGFTLCLLGALLNLDKARLSQLLGIPHQTPVIKLNPLLSVQRTWALLLTSVILYVPANILPIMSTRFLGQEQANTILGGVSTLWQTGSYPVALVIFVASIVVPVAKIVILAWLNYSVHHQHQLNRNQRIFWYRITEFIGRWSMVDVFVVAILVGLIQLGNTMSILPGIAALAFCGVVIATMLAAMTFNTKLIWESETNNV